MHRLVSLISIFSRQCQLPKHSFKLRQKTPFNHIDFKIFSAVTTSKKSFHLASEGTIRRPCFTLFSVHSNSQAIISNIVKLHSLATLISNYFSTDNFFWKTNSGPAPRVYFSNLCFARASPLGIHLSCTPLSRAYHQK